MPGRFAVILLLTQVICCLGSKRVETGLEVAQSEGWQQLLGRRTAVLCTPAAVFPDSLVHVVDELSSWHWRHRGVNLAAVLAAEHGFRGDRQAEHGDPQNYTDNATGLIVYSVYRKAKLDLQTLLKLLDVDVVLIDFQDVGIRLYTFVWTMYDLMDAISTLGDRAPKIVVLDRPNPIGGLSIEGPMLNLTCCTSRYGKWPIPHRHGMTLGELARLFNGMSFGDRILLKVHEMVGWRRAMSWVETGLPWIPPSPNLPTPESTLAYGQSVFVEATTISEGRGTCTPFSLLGAPFINASQLAVTLNIAVGVKPGQDNFFRPAYFTPTFFKHNFTVCAGVQSVRFPNVNAPSCADHSSSCSETGSTNLSLFETSLHVLFALKTLYPEHFHWDGSWFGVPGSRLLDLYAGTPLLREYLAAGLSPQDVARAFAPEAQRFEMVRAPFLLYSATSAQTAEQI